MIRTLGLEGLEPIPIGRQKELLFECEQRLFNSCLQEKCCCVCDCLHPAREIQTKSIKRCKVLLMNMKRRLRPPLGLPSPLVSQYDASDADAELAGMLLLTRDIVTKGLNIFLQMCKACLDSLSHKKLLNAPKFAIADGLHIGELGPEFKDSTMTEHSKVNLAQSIRFIAVVQGDKHSTIRSHAYYFRSALSPPADLLPVEVVSKVFIGVTMVGYMTSMQKAKTLKRYQVRVSRILKQMCWYRDNIHLYGKVNVVDRSQVEAFSCNTSVVVDSSRGKNESGEEDNIDDSSDSGGPDPSSLRLAQQLDESRRRHNELYPSHENIVTADEEILQQATTALVTNFGDEDYIQLTRRVLENNDVIDKRSSAILSDFGKEFWVFSFCELFPYGRGGLDEERSVSIGFVEFVRYCLRLSSRRFAQHPSFSLVAFDIIAGIEQLNPSTSGPKCHRKPYAALLV
ncbi:hypothetical protein PHMEG_00021836 [Phytophthora megakarya]|uniref:DUF6570 domain-containing protein n=1 Tax=Phytophthora megakarya TaxID=4795 RepID=A0A225VM74_9STRA|nr:hypothetical protein PHMEG_00021836 [Phytophthora megakarya]